MSTYNHFGSWILGVPRQDANKVPAHCLPICRPYAYQNVQIFSNRRGMRWKWRDGWKHVETRTQTASKNPSNSRQTMALDTLEMVSGRLIVGCDHPLKRDLESLATPVGCFQVPLPHKKSMWTYCIHKVNKNSIGLGSLHQTWTKGNLSTTLSLAWKPSVPEEHLENSTDRYAEKWWNQKALSKYKDFFCTGTMSPFLFHNSWSNVSLHSVGIEWYFAQ